VLRVASSAAVTQKDLVVNFALEVSEDWQRGWLWSRLHLRLEHLASELAERFLVRSALFLSVRGLGCSEDDDEKDCGRQYYYLADSTQLWIALF